MDEALTFFRTYEMWMYVILLLAGLIYIRRFILAWEELRRAAFGLERESAQSHLNQSAGMLVLLFIMAVAIFVIVSFVAPAFPASTPLQTPTMDLPDGGCAFLDRYCSSARGGVHSGADYAIRSC